MIAVKNLYKSFGDVKAVDNLSFKIKTGEIVGLLGPNGAGKTTTMRLLTGFLFPDRGRIQIDHLILDRSLEEAQKRIGYLPENNPLYKDMLVCEMLYLSMALKHIRKNHHKEALDFAVKSAGISEIFYHKIGNLSKGYKQRVGLALALLRRPSILILDEPTEGLDPNQRQEIRTLIKKLSHKRTILMSTHVMAEATAVCNRILILHKGKLVADGTPDALSHLAQSRRILHFDFEGQYVKERLKDLVGGQNIKFTSGKHNRWAGTLLTARDVQLQPKLSQEAREHAWTIWQMHEEEHNLEDIFQKLTRDH